ncbi:hypothetical protein SCHIN_v1c07850 [Spiroplasma chinense]|uniref:Uncharacterized protein n=1 Tax=Spiroplasma chinense TaxID=216932 RepID=A0A5B9Y4U6_9MOLU|nr:hypothetical protein [Spiroplasma chinense]QEH61980.1 hypothetical protein SCHIN_v1c07850 [Spiroplasma chinense]
MRKIYGKIDFNIEKVLVKVFDSFYIDFMEGYNTIFVKNQKIKDNLFKTVKISNFNQILNFSNNLRDCNGLFKLKNNCRHFDGMVSAIGKFVLTFIDFYKKVILQIENNKMQENLTTQDEIESLLNIMMKIFKDEVKETVNSELIVNLNKDYGNPFINNDQFFRNLANIENDEFYRVANNPLEHSIKYFEQLSLGIGLHSVIFMMDDNNMEQRLEGYLAYLNLIFIMKIVFTTINIVLIEPRSGFRRNVLDFALQNVWFFSQIEDHTNRFKDRFEIETELILVNAFCKRLRRDVLEPEELETVMYLWNTFTNSHFSSINETDKNIFDYSNYLLKIINKLKIGDHGLENKDSYFNSKIKIHISDLAYELVDYLFKWISVVGLENHLVLSKNQDKYVFESINRLFENLLMELIQETNSMYESELSGHKELEPIMSWLITMDNEDLINKNNVDKVTKLFNNLDFSKLLNLKDILKDLNNPATLFKKENYFLRHYFSGFDKNQETVLEMITNNIIAIMLEFKIFYALKEIYLKDGVNIEKELKIII